MSDKNGNALFHSNGYSVFNMDGSVMQNGEGLYATPLPSLYPFGPPFPMSMMALPRPGHENDYYLIHLEWGPGWHERSKLIMSLITNAEKSGEGRVAYKNKPLFDKGHWLEFFQATKHANGRDWWVVLSDADSNTQLRTFYSFFIGADTAYLANTQYIEGYEPVPPVWANGTWHRIFSPNGKYLITLDLINGVRIHPFDRCSGLLGALETLPYMRSGLGGLAISPDSRFLYVNTSYCILQYDLTADNISDTQDTIALYDGFIDTLGGGVPVGFATADIGPDGKLYYLSSYYIHYIAKPNKKGTACSFVKRGLKMPTYAQSPVHYPNYRLGPLDGSPCDTLGLNNEPLADFWWFSDSTLTVEFSDNSFYEPAEWHWDFGEGGVSQDTNPVHTFPAPGIYTVCLTVSNQYAADSVCKQVKVGLTTGAPEVEQDQHIFLFPNPATDYLQIIYRLQTAGNVFHLYDPAGRLVMSQTLPGKEDSINVATSTLPAGLYFYHVRDGSAGILTGKVVVAR